MAPTSSGTRTSASSPAQSLELLPPAPLAGADCTRPCSAGGTGSNGSNGTSAAGIAGSSPPPLELLEPLLRGDTSASPACLRKESHCAALSLSLPLSLSLSLSFFLFLFLCLCLCLCLSVSVSVSLLYRAAVSLHRSDGRGRVGWGGPLQTRSGRARRRAAPRRPRGAARPPARAVAPASAPRGQRRAARRGAQATGAAGVRRGLRGGGRGLEGGAGCAREEEEQRCPAGVGH